MSSTSHLYDENSVDSDNSVDSQTTQRVDSLVVVLATPPASPTFFDETFDEEVMKWAEACSLEPAGEVPWAYLSCSCRKSYPCFSCVPRFSLLMNAFAQSRLLDEKCFHSVNTYCGQWTPNPQLDAWVLVQGNTLEAIKTILMFENEAIVTSEWVNVKLRLAAKFENAFARTVKKLSLYRPDVRLLFGTEKEFPIPFILSKFGKHSGVTDVSPAVNNMDGEVVTWVDFLKTMCTLVYTIHVAYDKNDPSARLSQAAITYRFHEIGVNGRVINVKKRNRSRSCGVIEGMDAKAVKTNAVSESVIVFVSVF
jgi:hypothetical protein